MEHLLSVWSKVAMQLRDARHVLLLTDYDGTLTPIVERPELANLAEDTRRSIRSLSRQHHFTLGVISGRALGDLKDKVGLDGIIYAGNHGMEIEGPGITFITPLAEETSLLLRTLYRVLTLTLGTIRGVLIENKGLTLSVHYRQVEESKTKDVKHIFDNLVGSAQTLGKVKVTPGKKVYEVRPAVTWDKGKAIKLLMKKYGKGGRRSGLLPFYFGDDLTDEDGFKVIENYGNGISVFVGEPSQYTTARYFLKSPVEVAVFLVMLLREAQTGFKRVQSLEMSKEALGDEDSLCSCRSSSLG